MRDSFRLMQNAAALRRVGAGSSSASSFSREHSTVSYLAHEVSSDDGGEVRSKTNTQLKIGKVR